jgi:hypothetical protein
VDKELLFKLRLIEQELDLAGVGVVRLRALSRDEVTDARDECVGPDDELDAKAYERLLVSLAMVDPELTTEDVARWSAAAPAGEFVRVMDLIRDLSALDETESPKSRLPANRQERRAAIRTRSRARPGKDSG